MRSLKSKSVLPLLRSRILTVCRPFLQQNEKLQTAEAEIQELQRRLREKDLLTAELQNELNKSQHVLSLWYTLFLLICT